MNFTKKIVAVLLSACTLTLVLAGCSASKKIIDTQSNKETDMATITETLGLDLKVPDDAVNVKYFLTSGDSIAVAEYESGDSAFVFNAQAMANVDVSGIDSSEKEVLNSFDLSVEDVTSTISIYDVKSGGLLAEWSINGVSFSLYQKDASSDPDSQLMFADSADIMAKANPNALKTAVSEQK